MKKTTLRRAVIYAAGIAMMAVGATLGTKTGMGISPINAIPFAMEKAFGIGFSTAVFMFYAVLILLQFLILGKERRWRDLLQLPFSVVFSALLGVLMPLVPEAKGYDLPSFLVLAAATVCLGIGIALSVDMQVVPNPADGLAFAMSRVMKRDLGFAKNLLDFICVSAAFAIDVFFGTVWTSIGVTTVISTIFIGRVVYGVNRLFKEKLMKLAGLE